MFSIKYLVLVLYICCLSGGLSKHLPNYIQVCKRDPATINECVLQSIESLRPRLAGGLPELNVPGIDPFYIPEIVIVSGNLLPLSAVGKDVKVTGAGNYSITSLYADLDTLTFKARVRFPKLQLEGRYIVDLKILLVPIKGQGTLKSDAVTCDADLVLKGQMVEKNGVQYLKFSSLQTNINIKDYRIQLEGLFNGDKVLGDATNQALNQNRGGFLKAVKPYLESTASKLFLDISNKVIDGIPFDELLPAL